MPANIVKNARDERLWQKAKKRAAAEGKANDYAYVTGIFKKMKGMAKSQRLDDMPAPQGLVLDLQKAERKVVSTMNSDSLIKSDKEVAAYLALLQRAAQLVESGTFFSSNEMQADTVKAKLSVLRTYASEREWAARDEMRKKAKAGALKLAEKAQADAERWMKLTQLVWKVTSYINNPKDDVDSLYRSDSERNDLRKSLQELRKATANSRVSHTARSVPAYRSYPGMQARLAQRGANPNVTPEQEKYIHGLYDKMPTPKLRLNPGNFNEPADVVKGLGFSPADEKVWADKVRKWTNTARTEVDLRKALFATLSLEKSMNNVVRSEIARRTMLLFKEQRRQAGDFVVKAMGQAGGRQSTRGKRPIPPNGRQPNGNGEPEGPPRVDTHPGGKGEEPEPTDDDEMMDDEEGGEEQQSIKDKHFGDPDLDTAPLDGEPEDEGNICAELEKLHKQLHDLHAHLEHTPGEIHLHNELVALMRKVYAKPTPDGLREVRHQLHHFVQMVQGPEEGTEPPDDPNGKPKVGAPQNGDDVEDEDGDGMQGDEDTDPDGPPQPIKSKGKNGKPPPGKDKDKSFSKSTRWGGLPFDRGQFFFIVEEGVYIDLDDLVKGAGHKYVRRVPTGKPKPKYRYVYTVDSEHHDEDVVVGEKLRIKHGDKEGHYEVTKVSGNKVTVRHDETGHERVVDKSHLHDIFAFEHAAAVVKKYKELKKTAQLAMQYGSRKQKQIAIRNVDRFSERYNLPPFKLETPPEMKRAAQIASKGVAKKLHDEWSLANERLAAAIKAKSTLRERGELRTAAHAKLKALMDHMKSVGKEGTAAEQKAAREVVAKVKNPGIKRALEKHLGDAAQAPTKQPGKKPTGAPSKKPKRLDPTEPGISRDEKLRRNVVNEYHRLKATGNLKDSVEANRKRKLIESLGGFGEQPKDREPDFTPATADEARALVKRGGGVSSDKGESSMIVTPDGRVFTDRTILGQGMGAAYGPAEMELVKDRDGRKSWRVKRRSDMREVQGLYNKHHKDPKFVHHGGELDMLEYRRKKEAEAAKKTIGPSGPSGESKKQPGKKPSGAPSKKTEGEGSKQKRWAFGEHIEGSAKDKRALSAMLQSGRIGELSNAEAVRHINKKSLMPALSADEMRGFGASPGGAHLALQLAALVGAKPPGNTAEDRANYAEGVRIVAKGISQIRTVEDAEEFRKSLIDMANIGQTVSSHEDYAAAAEEADRLRKATGEPHNVSSSWDMKNGTHYSVTKPNEPVKKAMLALGRRFVTQLGIGEVRRGDLRIHGRTAGMYDQSGKVWRESRSVAKASERLETESTGKGWENIDAFTTHKSESRKAKAKGRKASFRWRPSVAKVPDLKGTAKRVKEGDRDRLGRTFNFHGIQRGEAISDKDLEHHLRHAEMGFHDLADVIGIEPDQVSMKGRLSIAFGARGRGGAAAHYEPSLKAINVTRFAGAGSLAHEWGHFLDNIIAEQHGLAKAGEVNAYASERHAKLPAGLADAMKGVVDAMTKDPTSKRVTQAREESRSEIAKRRKEYDDHLANRPAQGESRAEWMKKSAELREAVNAEIDVYNALRSYSDGESDFSMDAKSFDKGKSGKYWSSRREMFARAFEAYVQDKLEDSDRRNSYLVDGTRVKYSTPHGSARLGTEGQPYPQGETRKRINKAFDKLMAEMKKADVFQKALDWLDDLRKAEADFEDSRSQPAA